MLTKWRCLCSCASHAKRKRQEDLLLLMQESNDDTCFPQANIGLRTKKTARLEQESSESNGPFSLGLSLDSVKYYSIGT